MPKGIKGFQKGNQCWKNWKSRPDYSGKNNPNYGRKHTPEEIQKIKNNCLRGENHKDWKGDKVGKIGLHYYIKRYLPKPELCQKCGKKKFLELSNNGKYTRNLAEWEWICKSCHAKKDKKITNIKNASNQRYIDSIHN